VLIHLFEPRLNLQRAKWKNTLEYIQHVPELGDDEDQDEEA
jgi:hypothetical protein